MKAYVKPELFYERYELSKHIADCAFELNSGDEHACDADVDPTKNNGLTTQWTVFLDKTICQLPIEEYCYTSGTESSNIFMS